MGKAKFKIIETKDGALSHHLRGVINYLNDAHGNQRVGTNRPIKGSSGDLFVEHINKGCLAVPISLLRLKRNGRGSNIERL